jgi:hypothetical protein
VDSEAAEAFGAVSIEAATEVVEDSAAAEEEAGMVAEEGLATAALTAIRTVHRKDLAAASEVVDALMTGEVDPETLISNLYRRGRGTMTATAMMGTAAVAEGRSGRMRAEVGMMRVAVGGDTRMVVIRRIITRGIMIR